MVLQAGRRRLGSNFFELRCDWQQGAVVLYNVGEACRSVLSCSAEGSEMGVRSQPLLADPGTALGNH